MANDQQDKGDSYKLKSAIVTAISVIAVAVITGIFALLQRQGTPSSTAQPMAVPTSIARKALQRIDFNYTDSPANHGWDIEEPAAVTFSSETDGYQGAYLSVQSNDEYAMDAYVDREALSGTHLTFVSKFETGVVYAHVIMKGRDGSTRKMGWLQFSQYIRSFEQLGDEDEWLVPVDAIAQGGGWSLIQIDLADAVRQSFGNRGWQYAQIDRIRIRGNIVLAYIEISE